MTPLKRSNNLAARMGRWSAHHWKTATLGWLAFVAVAFLIGSQIGTKELSDADGLTGESAQAQRIIDEEFPGAYKDVDEVVDVVHGAKLAIKVARLRPVGVIKG